MHSQTSKHFAISAADQMISTRFKAPYGTSTLAGYFDHLDYITTAHLIGHHAARVIRISGQQRRNANVYFGACGGLLIYIPVNDPRTNETVWVTLDLPIWLDLMEIGASGSWVFNYKSKKQKAAQVRVGVPFKGKSGPNLATITRIIGNAKSGQQARLHDGNPLNLRRANIYVVGNPNTAEGRKGRATTDTCSALRQAADLRYANAGAEYDYKRNDVQ